VAESRLDSVERCEEQLSHYLALDPESLELRPLKGGLLLRRHHEPRVVAAMDLWFAHVLRYSRRDQLSLRHVLRAASLEPRVLDLDNFDSKYHRWPASKGRIGDRSLWLRPQGELEQAELRLAGAESELAALRASRSWRWTSPARGTLARLRPSAAPQAISDSASPEPSQAAISR